MTDQTRTVPEREAELLLRLTKVFAMLADVAYHIADGYPDEAEELLGQLSDAECFVTSGPCVGCRTYGTGAGGFEPPTSWLTARRSAN